MEKFVENFISKLSWESQNLIRDKFSVENMSDKFFINHSGVYFCNDFGRLEKADETRLVGELETVEIEFITIVDFLLESIIAQKKIIKEMGHTLDCVVSGYKSKEERLAEERQLERERRLTELFKEYGDVYNFSNSVIMCRLEENIKTVLQKDNRLQKHLYNYAVDSFVNSPGFVFRVFDKNKVILDNRFIPSGD